MPLPYRFASFSLLLLIMSLNADAQERTPVNELLQQMLRVVDIRAEGSPPFHMRATVQTFEDGKPASKGSYDLEWRSPTSWQEEIRLDNLRQIRIADGDKLWQDRNLPYFTESVEQIG